MKSKLVIIVCIGILLTVIFLTRSNGNGNDEIELEARSFPHNQPLRITDQPNHLFYFVQISDIHISILRDKQRIHDFRTFVHDTLQFIKPPVVVASGDLTDARGRNYLTSQQLEEEWKTYNEILTTANVTSQTRWLDLRGNHDTFNVPPSFMDEKAHFKRYSIQGAKHKRSYMELVRDSSDDLYSFLAIDATLDPGLTLQYNFLGMLTQNDTDHLQSLVNEAKIAGVNYTIWFGHYPTTYIVTKNKEDRSIRRMISDYDTSLAYLCGHLHTMSGLVPHMYALQENSFLELEVADWKKNRKYRVAAVDHGLLSFVDVEFGTWPIVLITIPKHALFQIPNRKEAKTQLESTHIRILIFSQVGVKSCAVEIGKDFHENCVQVSENLFVVPWDPERYREGLHYITVTVVDNDGHKKEVVQPFRLDEKQSLSFDTLAQFVLHTEATTIFKSLFWFSILICVLPLIYLRIWHELIKAGILSRMRANCRASMSIIQHYWTLAAVDRIFWPVIFYCFYLAVGPWVLSEIVDGHYGVVFVWGIYFDGAVLPGSLTYFYGFAQLLLCQFPMNWVYSRCLAKRYYQAIGMPTKSHRGWSRKFSRALFFLIITIEVALSLFFGILYGAVAFFTGVFRTWSVVMNIYLYYLARNVPDYALRSAIYAWSGPEKSSQDNQLNREDENHTN